LEKQAPGRFFWLLFSSGSVPLGLSTRLGFDAKPARGGLKSRCKRPMPALGDAEAPKSGQGLGLWGEVSMR